MSSSWPAQNAMEEDDPPNRTPNFPGYDSEATWVYFSLAGTDRLRQWRERYFHAADLRCDRCYVFRIPCLLPGACDECLTLQLPCTISAGMPAPQAPGAPSDQQQQQQQQGLFGAAQPAGGYAPIASAPYPLGQGYTSMLPPPPGPSASDNNNTGSTPPYLFGSDNNNTGSDTLFPGFVPFGNIPDPSGSDNAGSALPDIFAPVNTFGSGHTGFTPPGPSGSNNTGSESQLPGPNPFGSISTGLTPPNPSGSDNTGSALLDPFGSITTGFTPPGLFGSNNTGAASQLPGPNPSGSVTTGHIPSLPGPTLFGSTSTGYAPPLEVSNPPGPSGNGQPAGSSLGLSPDDNPSPFGGAVGSPDLPDPNPPNTGLGPSGSGPGAFASGIQGNDGKIPSKCRGCSKARFNCDFDPNVPPGLGCTGCRKVDIPCLTTRGRVFQPRPDGMIPPLCCDQCLSTGIKSCPWRRRSGDCKQRCAVCVRKGINCTYTGISHLNLVDREHTHLTRTQTLPPNDQRPHHLHEDTSNPRQHFFPSREWVLWNPEKPIKEVQKRCDLCRNIVCNNTSITSIQCEAQPGGQGCIRCRQWGVVCRVGDEVLPPREGAQSSRHVIFTTCPPCAQHERRCDRQRPCVECVRHNIPEAECIGQKRVRGCFRYGTVPGVDMPAYFIACGYGPNGLDDNVVLLYYEQPADYHLQYLERERNKQMLAAAAPQQPEQQVGGGQNLIPNTGSPGLISPQQPGQQIGDGQSLIPDIGAPWPISGPIDPGNPNTNVGNFSGGGPGGNPFADASSMASWKPGSFLPEANVTSYLQLLSYTLITKADVEGNVVLQNNLNGPLISNYEQIWTIAKFVAENGGSIDLEDTRRRLRNDVDFSYSVGLSFVCEQVRKEFDAIRTLEAATAVHLPGDSNPATIEQYNPGFAPILNASRVPTTRPPSLGPLQTFFNIPTTGLKQDIVQEQTGIINHPFPWHPNPRATPILRTIPLLTPPPAPVATQTCMAMTKRDDDHIAEHCDHQSNTQCEDTTHGGVGSYICIDCNQENRGDFIEMFSKLIMRLRIYACAQCAQARGRDPWTYTGTGHRVWGCPPFQKNADNPKTPAVQVPAPPGYGDVSQTAGEFMGPVLPVTGCSCAMKLCDKTICKPHRLKYLLQMERAAHDADTLIRNEYGRRMCFLCRERPSVDHYDFEGPDGESDTYVYNCVACLDIVSVGSMGRGLLPGGQIWGFSNPEPSPVDPSPNPNPDNGTPDTGLWGPASGMDEPMNTDPDPVDPGPFQSFIDPNAFDPNAFDPNAFDPNVFDSNDFNMDDFNPIPSNQNAPGPNGFDPNAFNPNVSDPNTPDPADFIDPSVLQFH